MIRKRIKIKNEKLFVFFSSFPCEETGEGKQQFFKAQSLGDKPSDPDPYYKCLVDGKKWFDFLCSEYQQLYFKGEWWGWCQLWKDWEGERWVLPYICKWHKSIPKWISDESFNLDDLFTSQQYTKYMEIRKI